MRRFFAVISLVLPLAGCVLSSSNGGDGGGAPEDGDPPGLVPAVDDGTVRAALARPRTLAVRAGSVAEVTAHRLLGDDLVETATLAIHGGELTARALADGRLAVDSLRLVVGDVHLSPQTLPPSGLDLTEITVHARPVVVAARWPGGGGAGAVTASAEIELLLDWSLAKPGQLLPMATQHIAVPLVVEISRAAGGKLAAALRGARDGVFFTWSGLLELGDLRLDVVAGE